MRLRIDGGTAQRENARLDFFGKGSLSEPKGVVHGIALTSMSVEFCDTNVLVYAYDVTAGKKREQAQTLLARLWDSGEGATSIQVLQELFVTLTRKVPQPLPALDVRGIISDMTTWQVVGPRPEEILAAIDGMIRWRISFWDAMILTAAIRARAETVWSEDLSGGQTYDGVVVRNPFM